MALHGPIQVNGRSIGHWEAKRALVQPDDLPKGTYVYRTEVALGESRRFTGSVIHRYDDGPIRLMALVLDSIRGMGGHYAGPVKKP